MSNGAGDLSGVMDCYPYCSRSQDTAGVIFFYVPVLMAAFIVGALFALGIRYVRRTYSTISKA